MKFHHCEKNMITYIDTNTVFTSKTENFTDIIDHLVKNFEFDNHSITMQGVIFLMKK